MIKQYKSLSEYRKRNIELLSQPIVKSFFDNNPGNLILLEASEVYGIEEATDELDKRFVEHFFLYRLIAYISSVSQNFSKYYDKSKKKQTERFPLLINKSDEVSEGEMLDYLLYNNYDLNSHNTTDINLESSSIFELVVDEKLYKALLKLNKKELEVIKLLIIDQLKQIEVANLFNESPQSISKLKKNALLKIKNEYKKG